MAKVTLVQVVYNHRKFIPQVYEAIFKQTYTDFEMIAVICGNEDGGKEYIAEHFPQVKIIDPGLNIGFTKGHNLVFAQSNSEFFQLVNPDLILEPTYLENILKAFEDPKLAAATGKLLHYDFEENKKTNLIDTTGIEISKNGGGRDRGQHKIDSGQYDSQTKLIAVSGAGAMYRRSALQTVKYQRSDGSIEYFDEDFHSYWEDVDLSLRFINAGFIISFVPSALGYHGRGAASSPGGYKKVFAFIKHHKTISSWIRQLNYKNHIFLVIKNFPRFYFKFFIREFFYQIFVLVFEISTLKILPTFFKQLPLIWKKRKYIQKHRKITTQEFESLLK
jgi:GT2 family glycosyltransferase